MKTINICFLSFGLLFTFVLSGCHVPDIQLYSGPRLPNKEVAILRANNFIYDLVIDSNDIGVKVRSLGRRKAGGLSSDYNVYIAMLPGKHQISWTYSRHDVKQDIGYDVEIRGKQTTIPRSKKVVYKGSDMLDTKAGKEYEFYFDYKRRELISSTGVTDTYQLTGSEISLVEVQHK